METINLGRVAFVYKGDYSAVTTYNKMDVVFDGESSFVSQIDNNVGNPLVNGLNWKYLSRGNNLELQEAKQDIATLETNLSNKVYARTATGANIINLYGIKDVTIENAVNGLYYSIASVVKDANNTAINIYSSTDDLGTGATLKAAFTFANETGYAKKIIGASTGELFTLIVNTKEIPNNCSYTLMWSPNKYKLNGRLLYNWKWIKQYYEPIYYRKNGFILSIFIQKSKSN